jgi:hypothetical protein
MYNETVTSEKYIQDLLHIPTHFKVLCAVSVGYPAKPAKGRTAEELQYEKIRINQF